MFQEHPILSPDAKDWEGKPDKADLFSPNPGRGD
jgi:hypothetical protein